MNYEKETRIAYCAPSRALAYKKHHTRGLTWARFAMWRERACVQGLLSRCHLSGNDKILDSPCGTGILGGVLSQFSSVVVASDISREMMELARPEYRGQCFKGFCQADMTMACFRSGVFACVITIGFMHRIPTEIRKQVIDEITRLSSRFVIISCSIDSRLQRLKQWALWRLWSSYSPAPSLLSLKSLVEEFQTRGLIARSITKVAWLLSAEVVVIFEKQT